MFHRVANVPLHTNTHQRLSPLRRWMVHSALIVGLGLLSACSSVRPWVNEPLPAEDQSVPLRKSERDPSILVAVTLSGGGARCGVWLWGADGDAANPL